MNLSILGAICVGNALAKHPDELAEDVAKIAYAGLYELVRLQNPKEFPSTMEMTKAVVVAMEIVMTAQLPTKH